MFLQIFSVIIHGPGSLDRCYAHTTSENPGTSFRTRTQLLLSPDPFPIVHNIVISRTLSLSKPVHVSVFRSCVSCVSCAILCLPFLYTSHCYVSFLASDIPALMLCLSIPYIRLPLMYAFDMFEYRL